MENNDTVTVFPSTGTTCGHSWTGLGVRFSIFGTVVAVGVTVAPPVGSDVASPEQATAKAMISPATVNSIFSIGIDLSAWVVSYLLDEAAVVFVPASSTSPKTVILRRAGSRRRICQPPPWQTLRFTQGDMGGK